MNEQLIVKNFGPIKDATVDFKRVTVFIGPTGGGKSTLAKLFCLFKTNRIYTSRKDRMLDLFSYFNISSFLKKASQIDFNNGVDTYVIKNLSLYVSRKSFKTLEKQVNQTASKLLSTIESSNEKIVKRAKSQLIDRIVVSINDEAKRIIIEQMNGELFEGQEHIYVPSERAFLSAIEYSWAGLMRDDIGLPKLLLDFANSLSLARKAIKELEISFFNARYLHIDGRDFIKIPNREEPLMLLEAASGIQSVTPLLVLLEHLSRNNEQAQSFIIEEPELNLYPTAQQGLLNWLTEKCTKGENDLTITTHSPYILSHLNLLLYAYQVAEKHPDRREAVAAIVPEASWINPKEFACYQVENGGVQSLVDEELGLIDNNELDGLSGDAADAFDNLIRLSKGFAIK